MVTRKRREGLNLPAICPFALPLRRRNHEDPESAPEAFSSRQRPDAMELLWSQGFIALGLLVTVYSALGPLSRKLYKAGTPCAARVERVRPAGEPGLPREEAEETVGRVSRLRTRALSTCSSLPFSQYRTEVTASRSARSAPRAGREERGRALLRE